MRVGSFFCYCGAVIYHSSKILACNITAVTLFENFLSGDFAIYAVDVIKDNVCSTHPCRALEYIQDLLLGDWLVGGLWVGLGSRGQDGVNVNIN